MFPARMRRPVLVAMSLAAMSVLQCRARPTGGAARRIQSVRYEEHDGAVTKRTVISYPDGQPHAKPPPKRRSAGRALAGHKRALAEPHWEEAVFSRTEWRNARLGLAAGPGEHACFRGYGSSGAFCGNSTRQAPAAGEQRPYENTAARTPSLFELSGTVAGMVHIWREIPIAPPCPNSTVDQEDYADPVYDYPCPFWAQHDCSDVVRYGFNETQQAGLIASCPYSCGQCERRAAGVLVDDVVIDVAIKSAEILVNTYNTPLLRPAAFGDIGASASWMDRMCEVFGSLPFMWTCSSGVNVIVQDCGDRPPNAWVIPSTVVGAAPHPHNYTGWELENDIIFYFCSSMVSPGAGMNPYTHANTFAHELAHVIQGGFGEQFYALTEGAATFLEGPLLGLGPRPIHYAWGFRDWATIMRTDIYETPSGPSSAPSSEELDDWERGNARKFYQLWSYFLAWVGQPGVAGMDAARGISSYILWDGRLNALGRGTVEYFLTRDRTQPVAPTTASLDVHNAFADALLDHRVALVSQCLAPGSRPTGPRYQMPLGNPLWDCFSIPTHWSTGGTGASVAADLGYGGAAFYRFGAPDSLVLRVGSDPDVRTKAVVVPHHGPATVQEVAPGGEMRLPGEVKEVLVVQVNADPTAEFLLESEYALMTQGWRRAGYPCAGAWCSGDSVYTTSNGIGDYPANFIAGLRSRPIDIPPGGAVLSMGILVDIEPGDESNGWDGVQVRAWLGNDTVLLRPTNATMAYTESYVYAFAINDIYPEGGARMAGWGGRQGPFTVEFNMTELLGQAGVVLEVLFSSDSYVQGPGVWVDDVVLRAPDGTVLFSDDAESDTGAGGMADYPYLGSAEERVAGVRVAPGAEDAESRVPVLMAPPSGYLTDIDTLKGSETRPASLEATWAPPAAGSESARRRAHLGQSYIAERPYVVNAETQINPHFEVVTVHRAPFRGWLKEVTLFTFNDKIGVASVSMSLREDAAPHAELLRILSPSPGPTDPTSHVWRLRGHEEGLMYGAGERILIGIGIGETLRLSADPEGEDPMIHLPVTSSPPDFPPFLLFTRDHGGNASGTVIEDPFEGKTLAVRAVFEAVPEVSCAVVRRHYRQHRCCGSPGRVVEGVPCSTVKSYYERRCCGTPARMVPRPDWIVTN